MAELREGGTPGMSRRRDKVFHWLEMGSVGKRARRRALGVGTEHGCPEGGSQCEDLTAQVSLRAKVSLLICDLMLVLEVEMRAAPMRWNHKIMRH